MFRSKKGQSTLEYIIIFTAIVAAVLVAAGPLRTKVGDMLGHAGDQAKNAVNKISF